MTWSSPNSAHAVACSRHSDCRDSAERCEQKRGQPKTTWQRTVMKELEEWGLTWSEHRPKLRTRLNGDVYLWFYVAVGIKRLSE